MQKTEKHILDRIAEKPIVLIAVAYPLVFIALTGIGLFMIANNNAMVQNQVPPKLIDTLSVMKELPVLEPRISSAVDLKTLSEPTPEMIDKGKATFMNVCISCHGAEGNGDGAAGAALNPKPRNFHAADGWKNGRKATEMFKTLQLGITGSGMSAYDYLPPEERIAVISYIRATFMKDAPKDAEQEITALDNTYKLSQGTHQPGQIPVADAQKLLQKSRETVLTKYTSAVGKVKTDAAQNAGARLFLNIAIDPQKALATLANSDKWNASKEELRKTITYNLGQNGFNGKASYLAEDELSAVYQYLKELLG
jgi:mono/diheme cytochrome c family protein